MRNYPSVSVIVPTLNEEKYLESCLKSIKNQDYQGEYEIIVSDGGSKDKTLKIAKKYADKVITCDKKGIAYGRNIFQHKNPRKLVEALTKIIHENWEVNEVLREYKEII